MSKHGTEGKEARGRFAAHTRSVKRINGGGKLWGGGEAQE